MGIRDGLISSAATLFIVTGAHAADMPVKAKPVEYVKICAIHGTGFYYIPGTDTCIKVGGFVRVQNELLNAGSNGQVIGSGGTMGALGRFNRFDTNDRNYLVRGAVTFDARTQTDYGTLRAFIRAGWENRTPQVTGAGTNPGGGTANNAEGNWWDRAFIQFAGFTVGRAYSFFDMFTYGSYAYIKPRTTGDTSFDAQTVWAYTVQFGNGVSYSLSFEDPSTRKFGTYDNSQANFFAFPVATGNDAGLAIQGATNQGFRVPDIITNLRVDQTWGYAGISTAIHEASGAYYGATVCTAANPFNCGVNNGHPSDRYGWAFSASGLLNLQGGDIVGVNVVWTKGAPGYAFNTGNWQLYNNSNNVAVAWASDGVFDTGGEVELTEAWSINLGYQHFWGPSGSFGNKWRTSVYGGYVSVNYSDRATQIINRGLPAGFCNNGVGLGTFNGWNPQVGNNCSPDFSFYQIGSRTQFSPHALLDIGLDVFYTKLNTAYKGPVNYTFNSSRPQCINSAILGCSAEDQGVLSIMTRWQRNFYP